MNSIHQKRDSAQPIQTIGLNNASFPRSIDVNPTARCNLTCTFCWGPDHSIADQMNTEQWKELISFFQLNGTRSIVFTGGEPLLRRDIGELVQHAKNLSMHITLSTNALLLKKFEKDVLPFIDEIGIPLDGSTQENNAAMRIGTTRSFRAVFGALDLISAKYPDIEVTVRTVTSQVNKHDLIGIGELLTEHREKIDRWKIYQFTPLSIGADNADIHHIADDEFLAIAAEVKKNITGLNIAIYPSSQRNGRYVFVDPQGNIFGDQAQGIGHRTVANYLTDTPSQIIQGVQQLIDETKNSTHAHPNSLARNLTTQHISTEVVDVVDEFDQVIGNAPRTEVYAEGLGHRIVHVLLFNSEGKLGLQLRSESAHYLPGHWSSAAGGHVQTGEDYLSAAVRECGEELGVNLPIEEIKKYVYTDQKLCKHTVLFKTVYDGPFQTNPAEVQGIEFFSLKEIDDMIAGGDKIHPELIAALRIFRQKL